MFFDLFLTAHFIDCFHLETIGGLIASGGVS